VGATGRHGSADAAGTLGRAVPPTFDPGLAASVDAPGDGHGSAVAGADDHVSGDWAVAPPTMAVERRRTAAAAARAAANPMRPARDVPGQRFMSDSL
jgi:hypothetical protein